MRFRTLASVLLAVCILVVAGAPAYGQASVTTITNGWISPAARANINANFSSLLANAPNGKAALTTTGAIPYISAAGTLGTATMLTRVSAGVFQVYDTTATTGASTFQVRAGAGQSTTPLFAWKNNGGANLGAVNGDGSVTVPYLIFVTGTEPTCDATTRSRVYVVEGGAGVADTARICKKDAGNAYAWTALY